MSKRVYTVNEISDAIKPALQKHDVVTRVVLFGSYAKGAPTKQSDIDLFIESDKRLTGFAFFGVIDDIAKSVSAPVDVYGDKEIPEGGDFHKEILQHGVTVYAK